MRAAKIEHLLGFGDPADGGAREAAASHNQAEDGDGEGLLRRADHGDVPVAAEKVDVRVDVVIGRNGVEDEVEAAGMLPHLVSIAGNDHFVRADAERVFFLVGAPEKPLAVSAFPLIFKRRSLSGSPIGGIPETQEMLDFCGAHSITADVEVIPIQKINEAYERLLRADVKYRFSIDMASLKAE